MTPETPLIWHDDEYVPDGPWPAGCAFFAPVGSVYEGFMLSKHYLEHVAAIRRPILVMIPTNSGGACTFNVDSHPTDKPDEAWAVTVELDSLVNGERPDITVSPSIHLIGLYHGHLQRGVLTPG